MKTKGNIIPQRPGKSAVARMVCAIAAGALWLVTGPGLVAQPVIPSTEPADQTSCLGGCLTYAVHATSGTLPYSYEWRVYYATNPSVYTVISGEASATITLCNLPTNGNRLRVVVTDAGGLSAMSRQARMTILEPPVITQQPTDAWPTMGESFTMSVVAAGAPPLSYQWYFKGQLLAGKTGSLLLIPDVQPVNTGDYYVVVSNTCDTVVSDTARLTAVSNTTFTQITTGPLVEDLGNSPSASIGDYDGDGYLDVFVNRNMLGLSTLYHNNGNGTFSAATTLFSPVSWGYAQAVWADFDNDGRLDLFMCDVTEAHGSFIAFNNGDGSFTKQDFALQKTWFISPVDYDQDGFLDLCFARNGNRLYRNLGGRNFQTVTRAEAGDLLSAPATDGSLAWADYDDDGRIDAFAASKTNFNRRCEMFHNEGGGRFLSVNNQVTRSAPGGWAAAWGDYDNDGRVDLVVMNAPYPDQINNNSSMYRNLGGGQFEQASVGVALGSGSSAVWGDYDNDGFLDLLTTRRTNWECSLFRNNGNGTFSRITSGPPVTHLPPDYDSSSASWFDYDNDGFLDVFVGNGGDSAATMMANFLYHNDTNANAWLKVKLVGTASNRDAVGAKVRVNATFAGASRWQRREITAGDVWGGNNNPIAHFGLADATIVDTVRVEWPSGQVTELHNVAVRQSLTITEAPGLRAVGLAGGTMKMEVTAHVGLTVGVEVSSNVVDWVPWQTWPQTQRNMMVPDPDAGEHPHRFYRARVK